MSRIDARILKIYLGGWVVFIYLAIIFALLRNGG